MTVPDVNLLIYAYSKGSPQHDAARRWWEACINEDVEIGLAWVVILAFLRITTRAGHTPLTPAEAVAIVASWLANPNVQIIHPGPNHAGILFALLEESGTAGNLTSDAHLAAIAMEHRAELASADTDFRRFKKLRWINPLKR